MLSFLFVFFGLIVFGYLGMKTALFVYDLITGRKNEPTYIDNSTHYHDHKHLTIINDNEATTTIED